MLVSGIQIGYTTIRKNSSSGNRNHLEPGKVYDSEIRVQDLGRGVATSRGSFGISLGEEEGSPTMYILV